MAGHFSETRLSGRRVSLKNALLTKSISIQYTVYSISINVLCLGLLFVGLDLTVFLILFGLSVGGWPFFRDSLGCPVGSHSKMLLLMKSMLKSASNNTLNMFARIEKASPKTPTYIITTRPRSQAVICRDAVNHSRNTGNTCESQSGKDTISVAFKWSSQNSMWYVKPDMDDHESVIDSNF